MAYEYGVAKLDNRIGIWLNLIVAVYATFTSTRLCAIFNPGCLLLSLLLALTSPLTPAGERCLGASGAAPAYSVDIVPQRAVLDTYRTWSQLLQRLGDESGLCFQLRISDNFQDFEHGLVTGIPDFVYMNPYHQTMAKRAAGYIPLVRDGVYKLTGVLVVRSDSPLHDLHELNGKDIAFPARNAFAASLLLRGYLNNLGIRFTPHYVGSHGNAYRTVLIGDVVAAGGANTTFNRESAALRGNLRVLYETPPTMAHPLAAHPRVPEQVREAVITTMLKMEQRPETQPLLDEIQIPHPVRADYTRDYKPLEVLELEQLSNASGK